MAGSRTAAGILPERPAVTSEPREKLGRAIRLVLRVLLGGVLVYAGVLKVNSPQLFADGVASFRLLPDGLVNPVAIGLPILEILAGLWLLSGWRQRAGAFCALALCLGFLFALGSAAARGLTVDCGCFGNDPLSSASHLPAAIARDLALLGAAAFLYAGAWRTSRSA